MSLALLSKSSILCHAPFYVPEAPCLAVYGQPQGRSCNWTGIRLSVGITAIPDSRLFDMTM